MTQMAFEKTQDAARGKWRGILLHFGLDPSFLEDRHGPCPICGGTDRFRFDDKDGTGSSYCSQCDRRARSGMGLLMDLKGWHFDRAAREVDKVIGNIPREQARPARTAESKRDFMKLLYQGSRPVKPGDPVWLYLDRRCGDPTGLLEHIRFHPELRHSTSGTTHPAMLAMMGWDGKRFSGIHRTYLTEDGFKAAVDPVRMAYGDAGAVRLGPVSTTMGIAEGIETAICAGHLFGLPVWSGICANGLLAWEPPPEVEEVLIFGDNDAHKTFEGQKAAFAKANALVAKGLRVAVHIPPRAGEDWANVWEAAQQEGRVA